MNDVVAWYRAHARSLIPTLYAAMSLLTFVAYALDKRAARKGAWRTPESTLHLLEFLGGWPGAWLAQRTLRHKSVKTSFRIVFFVMVALNVAGMGYAVARMMGGG